MVTGHGGSSGMITFREFYQREAERLWSGKHLRESKSKMAKFSDFNGYGERRLDDFKPADLYAYLDSVGERFTDNTVNHYAAAISSVFNHAVDMELITHAPATSPTTNTPSCVSFFLPIETGGWNTLSSSV
jgi:hypothetical protein